MFEELGVKMRTQIARKRVELANAYQSQATGLSLTRDAEIRRIEKWHAEEQRMLKERHEADLRELVSMLERLDA